MVLIEAIFYIEVLGNDKKAVETSSMEIEKKLKEERNVKIKGIYRDKVVENEEDEKFKYSTVVEAHVEGKLGNIVDLVLKYGPTIVEIENVKGNEIHAKELVPILGRIAYVVGALIDKFGPVVAYPKLDALPKPKIGYSEEEIERMIIEENLIRYRFAVEIYGNSLGEIEENLSKALFLEGCKINKIKVTEKEKIPLEDNKVRIKALAGVELLSDLKTLFVLAAKYAPLAFIIIEPEIINIDPAELQSTLSEIASIVNDLVHRPLLAE
ncbi:hypothetical protein PFDSM3638_07000 [Pyrococcus furiosus DSM 3638]|uniref:DUF2110 domain-containing protein n=3 Tax=Pyrococcus furiosus TaxID=2261 RepID=A0A5C0XW51_PYRFU|nr:MULTISPECIES: hypothetical protein [Pyrococcus]AAL81522.1 hypothetical protein PF1398 [Pyrococcus furiosus DSM 3638]AFN04179.1 hypothetical protein PFC_06215 [Pyrococcus furiosus COM1]MDK2868878.1 hypothetical protein [Pyrococcus sp.]QEK79030.1 hypothetical protein PFDSM3638_07000 [Pyrococcus furiosus DSM 3638]